MQNKIFPLGSTQDYSTELKTHIIIGIEIYSWHTKLNLENIKW
jgi:hypothetical protein